MFLLGVCAVLVELDSSLVVLDVSGFIYCAIVPLTIISIVIFALASLFQTIEWPSYDALVADFSTSKDRERAYSFNYLGANLGLVLSPTLAGFLFNNHLNLAFLINGIAIALSTVLIFFRIKDVHRKKDEDVQSDYVADLDSKASAIAFIFKNRVVLLFIKRPWLCFVAITVFTFGEIFNTLASSPFLTRRIPASHRGRIISVQNVACGIAGSGIQLLVGMLYDRSGSRAARLTIIGIGLAELIIISIMSGFDRKDYPALQK
ncbi:MAG: MFS transporter [Spirochaetales bacterium]|nr:MFS transporter [Spirochaetales bacterium]